MRSIVTASPAPIAHVTSVAEPEVSIVIVTYGTSDVVVDTIESIVESAPPLPYEVIVVDNPHPSEEGRTAMELSLSTSGVRVVTPDDNLGFGGGCELGALHARGDVIAFINPDVIVPPGWLQALVSRLNEPDVAIVAPVLTNPDGTVQEAGQRLLSTGATEPLVAVPAALTAVDYASGACWVMRATTHEALGGFDPLYHPAYFEDVDLALRARSFGMRLVVDPATRVVHLGGQGTPGDAPPASAQRDILLERWPAIRWQQPVPGH